MLWASTVSANSCTVGAAGGNAGVGGTGGPGSPPTGTTGPNGISGTAGSRGSDGSGGGVQGGGILLNTLIADNATVGAGVDVAGTFTSQGFNLIGNSSGASGFGTSGDLLNVNPLLGPLTDNGGFTFTCALLPGSPAINAGTNSGSPAFDQRGVSRPQGHAVDIGAYEYLSSGTVTPTISSIPDQSTMEGAATAMTEFTVGDFETAPADLIVSANSSDVSLVPHENIAFGGTDALRTITITPAPKQFGSSTITITVTDTDNGTATTSFLLTVEAVNDSPTLAPIVDQTMYEHAGTQVVSFSGISAGAINESNQTLSVSAISSNPNLIPNPTVIYSSPNGSGSLTFAPLPNAVGSATISVTVRDDGGTSNGGIDAVSRTFLVTVLPRLRFIVGVTNGFPGSEVILHVSTTGFSNISSFQFSLHWTPAMADLVAVENLGLPGLTAGNFGTNESGTLRVAWFDSEGLCTSVANGTILFGIRLRLSGSPGTTDTVTIDNTPVVIEALDCAEAHVPFTILPGHLTIIQPKIAGTITYGDTTNSVPGVLLNLTGNTNYSAVSGDDGSYTFTNVPVGGNYQVTPIKTNDNPTVNGISTADLALIQRHILGRGLLDSPYKLLAGDANGSNGMTAADLFAMQRLILGKTNRFAAGLWRFVPADYVWSDPQNPWNAPTNRSYEDLQDDFIDHNFVAIKLGDVNDSWVTPGEVHELAAKSPSAAGVETHVEVGFSVSSHVALPGQTVIAQIKVNGWRQVTSAQLTLEWDSTVLRYVNTGDGCWHMSGDNFGTQGTADGKLAFAWHDLEAIGVTTADGTTIFTVSFEVVGNAGNVSPLALSDSATPREVGVDFAVVTFGAQSGSVTVLDPATLPTVGTAEHSDGVFSLAVATTDGRSYILEFTPSLPSTNWTALPKVLGDGTIKVLIDPDAAGQQRFYRVRIE